MRAGFNPTRRNRNIGTGRQGHGQDNRLVIPSVCLRERRWAEQLNPHQQFQRRVGSRDVFFIVEETSGGCAHACTIEDICHVLKHVPLDDWEDLDTFVLRQSTRKQRTLLPAWGRMYYSADLGLPGRKTLRLGPAIMLEAMEPQGGFTWPSGLQPSDQAEVARLREDGHGVRQEGGRIVFTMTPAAIRRTQLYRTLLHEIGHWVDYLGKVQRPSSAGQGDYGALSDAYFARPQDEREAFAHRYADALRERLFRFGIFPFDPIPLMRRAL